MWRAHRIPCWSLRNEFLPIKHHIFKEIADQAGIYGMDGKEVCFGGTEPHMRPKPSPATKAETETAVSRPGLSSRDSLDAKVLPACLLYP